MRRHRLARRVRLSIDVASLVVVLVLVVAVVVVVVAAALLAGSVGFAHKLNGQVRGDCDRGGGGRITE